MDASEVLKEVRDDVKALHKKFDDAHKQITKNETDIAWLKRGMFGSFFSTLGAAWWAKFGGG